MALANPVQDMQMLLSSSKTTTMHARRALNTVMRKYGSIEAFVNRYGKETKTDPNHVIDRISAAFNVKLQRPRHFDDGGFTGDASAAFAGMNGGGDYNEIYGGQPDIWNKEDMGRFISESPDPNDASSSYPPRSLVADPNANPWDSAAIQQFDEAGGGTAGDPNSPEAKQLSKDAAARKKKKKVPDLSALGKYPDNSGPQPWLHSGRYGGTEDFSVFAKGGLARHSYASGGALDPNDDYDDDDTSGSSEDDNKPSFDLPTAGLSFAAGMLSSNSPHFNVALGQGLQSAANSISAQQKLQLERQKLRQQEGLNKARIGAFQGQEQTRKQQALSNLYELENNRSLIEKNPEMANMLGYSADTLDRQIADSRTLLHMPPAPPRASAQPPAQPQGNVSSAIISQESGGNPNAPTSVDGAVGPGQIMPATFKQYANPGEDISDPATNKAVSQRIIADFSKKYPGDPERIAVAYFSGEGNVAPPGSPTPWKKDLADGNGMRVSQYVPAILSKIGVGQGQPQGQGGAPQGQAGSPGAQPQGGAQPAPQGNQPPSPPQATPQATPDASQASPAAPGQDAGAPPFLTPEMRQKVNQGLMVLERLGGKQGPALANTFRSQMTEKDGMVTIPFNLGNGIKAGTYRIPGWAEGNAANKRPEAIQTSNMAIRTATGIKDYDNLHSPQDIKVSELDPLTGAQTGESTIHINGADLPGFKASFAQAFKANKLKGMDDDQANLAATRSAALQFGPKSAPALNAAGVKSAESLGGPNSIAARNETVTEAAKAPYSQPVTITEVDPTTDQRVTRTFASQQEKLDYTNARAQQGAGAAPTAEVPTFQLQSGAIPATDAPPINRINRQDNLPGHVSNIEPTEVQKGQIVDFNKQNEEVAQKASALEGTKAQLLQMKADLASGLQTGPWQSVKNDIKARIVSAYELIGAKPPADLASYLMSADSFQKNATKIAFGLSREQGAREPGSVIEMAVKNNPGMMNITQSNQGLVDSVLKVDTDRQIDKRDFFQQWAAKYQDDPKMLAQAGTVFNRMYPPEQYLTKVIVPDPQHPGQVIAPFAKTVAGPADMKKVNIGETVMWNGKPVVVTKQIKAAAEQ